MPLYEYKCDKCGEKFEVRQKFSDEPVQVHENCGGAVERLISTSAFNFKGSGWYVTDYAGKGKSGNGSAKTESASKDSASDTAGKSESSKSDKSDSKSEAKPTESKPASTDKSKSE